MRTAMVRIRSRLKNQIHALLADQGLHPEGSDIFAGDLTRMTKQLPAVTKQRAEANLRLSEELDKEVDLADSQIHKLFARDEGVRRLLPISGRGNHHRGNRGGRGRSLTASVTQWRTRQGQ